MEKIIVIISFISGIAGLAIGILFLFHTRNKSYKNYLEKQINLIERDKLLQKAYDDINTIYVSQLLDLQKKQTLKLNVLKDTLELISKSKIPENIVSKIIEDFRKGDDISALNTLETLKKIHE